MSDLNMDSTPEIVVANWEVEGMRVIHNFLPVNDNMLGDLNFDEIINIQDIVLLVSMVLSNEYNGLADMNSDEIINIQDIILLINIILS